MFKSTKLTDLVPIKKLEKILDNFTAATAVSCAIRDLDGELLTKMSDPSKIFLEITQHPDIEQKTHQNLIAALQKVMKTGQTIIFERYSDTYSVLVPIYIEGQISSFFSTGLVRYGNPNIQKCTEEAALIDVDIDTYLDMYLALPFVDEKKLMACANLLRIIGTTIATLVKEGNQAREEAAAMHQQNSILEEEITKNNRELHEREAVYRNLFHAVNDGVYITSKEGRWEDINVAGARMLGYKPEELIGQDVLEIYVNPKDRKGFLEKLQKEGHIELYRAHIQLKNGTHKYFETNAIALKDKDGNMVGVQGIFRDIGQRPPQHPQTTNGRAHTSITKKDERTLKTNRESPAHNPGTP